MSQVHPQQTKQVHDACLNDEYIKESKSWRDDWMQLKLSKQLLLFCCCQCPYTSFLLPRFDISEETASVKRTNKYFKNLVWAMNKFSANKSYSINEHFYGQIFFQTNRCAQFTCFFKDRCAWKCHFWIRAQHESESEGESTWEEVDYGSSYRQTQ